MIDLSPEAVIQRTRQLSIIKYTWTLEAEDRALCTKYFLYSLSLKDFMDRLFENDKNYLRDAIDISGIEYELHYMKCSRSLLEDWNDEGKQVKMLISCRVLHINRMFAAAIIRPSWREHVNDTQSLVHTSTHTPITQG